MMMSSPVSSLTSRRAVSTSDSLGSTWPLGNPQKPLF